MNHKPMLNAYPDSLGENLGDIVTLLKTEAMQDVFSSFYILPSLYHSDLDRGFSVIDYDLNEQLANREDLDQLKNMGIDLKLDFILNHASAQSPQFQDLVEKGEASAYRDFFIDWNRFWEGHGTMTEEGYIQPEESCLKQMFFRKPGLPILMVEFPDGKKVPYWNTFYQEIRYDLIDELDLMSEMKIQYGIASVLKKEINDTLKERNSFQDMDLGRYEIYREQIIELLDKRKKYLGQMDLNIKSALVWDYYEQTLKSLAGYGARIVRLDAFAYAPKEPGEKNFLNDPGTWNLLSKVQKLADKYHLQLLPEIHASYEEKTYELLSRKGYLVYDFFLPGLIIDAFEQKSGSVIAAWAQELYSNKIRVVNMLGCHDGIPILDLKGLIPEERIQKLVDIIVGRGGVIKNLHGQKNMYYQVNATYYSALGEDNKKMLLARAIQIFMPGMPQVWYLDLFAGKNDFVAMKSAGAGGHKEINRTNLSLDEIEQKMESDVVKQQIWMLQFRNTFPAFGFESELQIWQEGFLLRLSWSKDGFWACLEIDFSNYNFVLLGIDSDGKCVYQCCNLQE